MSFQKIKSIDFYRKIPRDLTEASLSGATLSVVAAISMIALFLLELRSYLTITATTTVIVDRSLDGDLLKINFNFSFPSLSCEFASVDVSDIIGTHRFNLTKTVRKYAIDHDLRPIGDEYHNHPVPVVTKHASDDDVEEHRLLKEYGALEGSLELTEENFDKFAQEFPIMCVNFFAPWCPWCIKLEPAWEKAATIMAEKYNPEQDGRIRLAKVNCVNHVNLCRKHHIQGFPTIRVFRRGNDVRENHGAHDHESYYGERDTESLVAFAEALVPPAVTDGSAPVHTAPALGNAGPLRRAPSASGCNIAGFVLVKKVPGNLMVSAHSGAHSFDASTMNLTHIVHHFSFGRRLSRRRQDAVDRLMPHLYGEDRLTARTFVSEHDNITHDHYLQVVMTEVQPLKRVKGIKHLESYDYTAHSNTLQSHHVPVTKFHYELSPMQVLITEKRRAFSHFLTEVCAIIGGVFTVAGIVDSMIHTTVKMIKKVELGKQF